MDVFKFEQLLSEKSMTIRPKRKQVFKVSDGKGKVDYPNLAFGLELDDINQLIVGDITYYSIEGKWYYIFTLKDVYSQRIWGLTPSESLEASQAIKCLEQAMSERTGMDLKGCIHHLDNGSQYNALAYKQILLDVEMQISRAKNCLENGSAENLNSIIKNMYLAPWGIRSFKDLIKACQELMDLNNGQRAIEQLGNLSPNQFEQLVAKLQPNERPKKILYMILAAKRDMGFKRHDFLNWNVGHKKSRSFISKPLDRTLRSTLSNYVIPSQVAPQQSLCPFHITVITNVSI